MIKNLWEERFEELAEYNSDSDKSKYSEQYKRKMELLQEEYNKKLSMLSKEYGFWFGGI